ncbi:MAG: diaminopimelate epimerase [Rikenellaceae bacterium]
MEEMKYIYGHGSGNHFVMIDAVDTELDTNSAAVEVRRICRLFGSDGLLFVEHLGADNYAMNMYNTDGTQAEMCGNGMRLVARFVDENYLGKGSFTLFSADAPYRIHRAERVSDHIPNYGVEIPIKLSTSDFAVTTEPFIDECIEPLHESLRFTYLNLGNPHIVARVEQIDLDLLSALGERVKELTEIFPKGVNVSMMTTISEGEIFVATYERGVGLTPSCGTAMTASSTAAALMGLCRYDSPICVRNRGGFVKCICHRGESGEITTQLIGNATYVERGVIDGDYQRRVESVESEEIEAWNSLISE